MALPTITNNSPSAGYIAWTAFGIQYNGVSYTVAAGNAIESFVIWKYNAGAPTILKTNAFPDTLTNDDQVLFLNKGGVGALIPTTNVLDGSLVVPGSIIANTIAANAIQTYHLNANVVTAIKIASNTITSNEIAANTITGDELAYNTITADKIGVGSVGNSLAINGSFEEVDASSIPTGWWGDASGTAGSMIAVTGIATSGTNAVQLALPAITDKIYLKQKPEKMIPVTSIAGRKWYLSAKIGAGTATTRGLYFRAVWYSATKSYISFSDVVTANQAVSTSFAVLEGQVTPPSTARYMGIEISMQLPDVATNVYVDEVIAREVVVSAVIGDGAITTPKIIANAINATHIAAGTLSASKLLVGSALNGLPDPSFMNPDLLTSRLARSSGGVGGWTVATPISTGITSVTRTTGTASDTFHFSPTLPIAGTAANGIQMTAGQKWQFSIDVETDISAGIRWNAYLYKADGSVTWSSLSGYSTAIGKRTLSYTYTVPAGVVAVDVALLCNTTATTWIVYGTGVIAMQADSTLIEDGAITSTHITGNAIDGKTITGATIQSSATALRGVKVDSTGIKAYSSTGVNTFSLDGTTGNMVATGTMQTSPTGTRVVVWDRADGTAAVDMYTDTTGHHGSLYTQPQVGNGLYVTNLMHYSAAPVTTTNWTARVTLFEDETWAIGQRTKGATVTGDNLGYLHFIGQMIRNNSYATETFVIGSTTQSQAATGTYALTYAAPVATGTRLVLATADAAAVVQSATQSATASGFSWIWSTSANASVSMRYWAVWTN